MAKTKLKTNRGAAKRFKATKSGFKHRCANRSHRFTGKSMKGKRQKRSGSMVSDSDKRSVSRLLMHS